MQDIGTLVLNYWQTSPPLVHALILLILGWLGAWVLKILIHGILVLVRFDQLAEKVGLGEFLRNGHVNFRPSRLVSHFVFQVSMLITFLVASRALDIEAVNAITDSLTQALPAFTAALFILIIGLVVVRFLCNVVETIARNTEISNVRSIVTTFRVAGYVVILLLASDQLGFGKSLLSTLLLIAFAATALGFAIAFGLGSVETARRIVENWFHPVEPPSAPRNHEAEHD